MKITHNPVQGYGFDVTVRRERRGWIAVVRVDPPENARVLRFKEEDAIRLARELLRAAVPDEDAADS